MANDLPYNEHCKPYLKEDRILIVISLENQETILYSIEDPSNCVRRSELHEHNTRKKEDIDLPYKRLKKA